MKKIKVFFLVFSVFVMCCAVSCSSNAKDSQAENKATEANVTVNFQKSSFSDVRVKAALENLPIMVDFYSDYCGGCVELDEEVFQETRSAAFINQRLICLKINGQKGEGPAVMKKYQVNVFPTVLLLNPRGEEIDRIAGYKGKDAFMKTLKDYLEGKNILSSIRAELKENPESVDINMKLAMKYMSRWERSKAKSYFLKTLELDPDNEKGYKAVAMFNLAAIDVRLKKNVSLLETFMKNNTDKRFYEPGYKSMIRFYSKAKDTEKVMEIYETALEKLGANADYMNRYAWFIYKNRLKEKYSRGIQLVQKALEIMPKKDNFWDTLAWLYYENGDRDKALEAIQKAVDCSTGNRQQVLYKERMEKIKNGNG
jgi:Tfp pilus assembly protein PilF/thioredoxin-related protein